MSCLKLPKQEMDKNYRELFFGETQEYLKEINKALVKLEADPQDYESLNVIFRLMHTIKGMAASMDYKELAAFAHRFEDVFDGFLNTEVTISAETMDIIFENIDAFTTLFDSLKEEKPPSIDIPLYLNKLDSIIHKEAAEKEIKPIHKNETKIDSAFIEKLQKEKKGFFSIIIHLTKDCPMKGVRAFLILSRSKTIGEIIKSYPSEESLKEEEFESSFEFIIATSESEGSIKDILSKILEIEKSEIYPLDAASLEKLEKKETAAPVYLKKIGSMRIPVDRLDKIMNLMGELVIVKSKLLQVVRTKEYGPLEETAYTFERLITSLQDEVLKTRLLPISYITDNFPRIVRDLARKENKEIKLTMEGGEIELDRIILDEIGDPLIHIIRNAIDHGIETPEERAKAGKSREGKISIKVYRDKGHIVIEISDDGKGIDYNNVVKRAHEMGLIDYEKVTDTDSGKILDILATPGFSTKDKVTDISGRGVGLDAVKNKMDILGGNLELENQPQKGVKFTLILPLTLAIIKAMLVIVEKQTYAIPLTNIKETIKIKKGDIKSVQETELIRLREEVIPLIRLDKELGIRPYAKDSEEISVVIVEGRIKNIGIAVDDVIKEQDIVVKPLTSFIKKIKGIAGATVLGDGRIAFILDVLNLR